MKIKHLIFVTKFKSSSERALTRALAIARDHDARLEILNVIDIPDEEKHQSVEVRVKKLNDSLTELIDHEKNMRNIIRKSVNGKWQPEAHIKMENPNDTRERLLNLSQTDFIVIGFGDWSGQLDLSAYMAPISTTTPPGCPVWMTPVKARKNLRKQVIIIGDSVPEVSQYDNFSRLCEVALHRKMSLDVFVMDPEARKVWKEWLKKASIEGYTLTSYKDMSEMRKEIENRKPGLVGVLIQSELTREALKDMDTIGRSDLVVI